MAASIQLDLGDGTELTADVNLVISHPPLDDIGDAKRLAMMGMQTGTKWATHLSNHDGIVEAAEVDARKNNHVFFAALRNIEAAGEFNVVDGLHGFAA